MDEMIVEEEGEEEEEENKLKNPQTARVSRRLNRGRGARRSKYKNTELLGPKWPMTKDCWHV